MVLGLRSKTRKGTSVQVDYLVQVQEIKPWPPSQSLKSAKSLLLQWENGDQSSGFFTSNFGDGKVEFTDSFRLSVTLYRESSRKSNSRDSFQKNYLEFNLYEPRKDNAMKGQLLGSAVINLADYGLIDDAITVSTPIHLKKSSKSTMQPILYVNILPFDRDHNGLSKQASLDKDGSETVSEVTNEGNEEECEIASFTDDDVDDNLSSHSSLTASSSVLESNKGSPGHHDKTESGSEKNGFKSVNPEPTVPAGMPPSNPKNLVNDSATKVEYPDNYIQMSEKSNHASTEESQTKREDDRGSWRHDTKRPEVATASNIPFSLMKEKAEKEAHDNGEDSEFSSTKKHASEEKFVSKVPQIQDAMRKPTSLRSNTLASNRTAAGVPGSTRRDKLMHLKSVQLQFNSTESDKSVSSSQFVNKENYSKIAKQDAPSEGVESSKKANIANLNSKVNVLKEESTKTVTAAKAGPASLASEPGKTTNEALLMEKGKEIDLPESFQKGGAGNELSGKKETAKTFSGKNAELESKVEMLEEELMEAAAVEVGLYSVVAEHGSSANKVLAPARRLSRFYLHASKSGSLAKRASAARAIISGLVLVSKACGNDVPRLSFWLSNSIVLRAIVSQGVEKLQIAAKPSANDKGGHGEHSVSPHENGDVNNIGSLDEWEEPQTYIMALEKVEAWIFSRIVESVWWQTLTPHMQSTAVKTSVSNKARKNGLADQVQGNFAIDLWKKAFKDSCERLCPIRAGGHECGCLTMLARLVMEQLVNRLDVAMFNAILRESDEEMPTDPVSDPISDPKVLPIPSGKCSFGAGAQLKNAVGSWSRWLTDLFGIDEHDCFEDKDESDSKRLESEASFKIFPLLNALSDLMMLPFEMLADRSTRKEVCPTFGPPLIKRVLYNFVPDEFNPDPVPEAIFEDLDSEDLPEAGEETITSFPCTAAPTIYSPPPAASLAAIIGEAGTQTLQRSASTALRKSYTSDDELDELDSPLASIIDNSRAFTASPPIHWTQKGKAGRKVVRYQLLREVWKDGE
ncbi:hypothetical protein Tsubulata_016458 [Turnera subulata]|uniref:C2 NT-type domain-containing protein n=1 Tax=Turnera subulata TaxID=218843 RepID=A0A9Q0G859_9ROSI|nr:hypothetical protein Tsubulata_016458 [Turnera subulata]